MSKGFIRIRKHVLDSCALVAKRGVLLSTALLLSACSPLAVEGPSVITVGMSTPDSFAAAVAELPSGAATILPSPYGEQSQVMAGDRYLSGLGQDCRPVEVRASGATHRLAVCKGTEGWYTAESIFEESVR